MQTVLQSSPGGLITVVYCRMIDARMVYYLLSILMIWQVQ